MLDSDGIAAIWPEGIDFCCHSFDQHMPSYICLDMLVSQIW